MTEDPKNPNVLYVGHRVRPVREPGSRRQAGRASSRNLPTVPIHEIVFHPRDNDMILATHGRSIWILDDATPLQQSAGGDEGRCVPVRHARRRCSSTRPTIAGSSPTSRSAARTRPTARRSASTWRRPQTNVALRIRDAAGTQVREITGNDLRDARGAGINRVYWDLRHQPLPLAQPVAGGRWRRRRWRRRWRRRQQRPERDARRVSRHAGRRRQGRRDQDGAVDRRQGHADDRRRAQDVARHGAGLARAAARRPTTRPKRSRSWARSSRRSRRCSRRRRTRRRPPRRRSRTSASS